MTGPGRVARERHSGGSAAIVIPLFNPAEVIEVRMQLNRRGRCPRCEWCYRSAPRQYTTFQSGSRILADDGVVGLFRLGPLRRGSRAVYTQAFERAFYPTARGATIS